MPSSDRFGFLVLPRNGILRAVQEDWPSQIELIPALTPRLSYDHSSVVRHGNLLAWLQTAAPASNLSNPGEAWDATLHTQDLRSSKRNTVKLGEHLDRSYRATALDRETVMAFSYVFDVATGQCLNAVEYTGRPKHLSGVFAVRNRIGYYVEDRGLHATELLSAQSPSLTLASLAETLCAATDEGLIAWDGTKWQTAPWLEEWPGEAE